MSQKKVEEYKKNKANRNKESKKEVFRRKLEIGIVLVIIAAGVIWFAIAGITRAVNGKSETIELKTTALDNYVYEMQSDLVVDEEPEEEAAKE